MPRLPSNTPIILPIDSEVTLLVSIAGRSKLRSGKITSIDQGKQILTMENAQTLVAEKIAFNDIQGIDLTDEFCAKAYAAVRLTSTTDASGTKIWNMGIPNNTIPDSSVVSTPPAPQKATPPSEFTAGSYAVEFRPGRQIAEFEQTLVAFQMLQMEALVVRVK